MKIRTSNPKDENRIMEIWRASVAATHDFLRAGDRDAIDAELQGFLPSAPLWVATDSNDIAQGFMLLDARHIEALFLHPQYRGKGIGTMLVRHAISLVSGLAVADGSSGLTTDVNEHNEQALGFYLHLGFTTTGRSPTDGSGRPYPLIHLRHPG